ncbi:MAG TPA: hypothetical protein VF911_18760 [Thermoanaerobaculia bacterium]
MNGVEGGQPPSRGGEAPPAKPQRAVGERPVETAGTFGLTQVSPNFNATLGTSDSTSAFTIFSSDDLPRLRVRGDGNVGIGTDNPTYVLDVHQNSATAAFTRFSNTNTNSAVGLRFAEGSVNKAHISSVGTTSLSASGPGALTVVNYLNAPITFGTLGLERMRILGNGNVAVGSTSDFGATFAVTHRAVGGYGMYVGASEEITANAIGRDDTAMYMTAVETVSAGVTNTGTLYGAQMRSNVSGSGGLTQLVGAQMDAGIGSSDTAAVEKVYAATVRINGGAGTILNGYGLGIFNTPGTGTMTNGYGLYITDIIATNDFGVYQVGANDTNYFAGRVGIGTTAPTEALSVQGNATVSGNVNVVGNVTGAKVFNAVYQDIADWVPATTDLAPGTVVVLNRDRTNEVMASHTSYDSGVAGVVSAQPGVLLGTGGEGQEQIATTGRVKVRVDARTSPIRVGDLLVTSDIPGTAMKSQPMEFNGRQLHQPGTLIGKALEPLEGGVGEILVLLSLQ